MRYTLTLLVLALAACGGGGTEPINPPPPPPPPSVIPGPPASVSVVAGDNQDAEPGKAVAVKPSVIVKDAQGRAVPGTQVGFAIGNGGGSVQTATVSTAGDGIASPGDWTLGTEERDYTLTATVGTLSPARFTARARDSPPSSW